MQTSSLTDIHISVLSCILNYASQESNANSDYLKLFEEGKPAHNCPIAIQCTEGIICYIWSGKNFLQYFDRQATFITDFSFIAMRRTLLDLYNHRLNHFLLVCVMPSPFSPFLFFLATAL